MKEEPSASTDTTSIQQASKVIFHENFILFYKEYFHRQPTEETEQTTDTFAASLNDPQFLRDVLRDLPGVDVDSEAVRAALEQVQQQQQQKKDTDDNDDNNKTKTKKDEK